MGSSTQNGLYGAIAETAASAPTGCPSAVCIHHERNVRPRHLARGSDRTRECGAHAV